MNARSKFYKIVKLIDFEESNMPWNRAHAWQATFYKEEYGFVYTQTYFIIRK